MCSGSGSAAANVGFGTQQTTNSMLGSAFLCCCAICNCKKLPNKNYTMCHCCIALRLFCICIVDAACETKKFNTLAKPKIEKNQQVSNLPGSGFEPRLQHLDLTPLPLNQTLGREGISPLLCAEKNEKSNRCYPAQSMVGTRLCI